MPTAGVSVMGLTIVLLCAFVGFIVFVVFFLVGGLLGSVVVGPSYLVE